MNGNYLDRSVFHSDSMSVKKLFGGDHIVDESSPIFMEISKDEKYSLSLNQPEVSGVKVRRVRRNCNKVSKALSVFIILQIIMVFVILSYITGGTSMFVIEKLKCPEGWIMFMMACYKLNRTPILASVNPLVNSIADGCSIPPEFTKGSDQFIARLTPACNMHDLCYFAIDALDYAIGVSSETHMRICDDRLEKAWVDGCDSIHPSDFNRFTCHTMVRVWITSMQALRTQGKNNTFYMAYTHNNALALKYKGTKLAVTAEYRPYASFPFIAENDQFY